jgi:hypothetical protein
MGADRTIAGNRAMATCAPYSAGAELHEWTRITGTPLSPRPEGATP